MKKKTSFKLILILALFAVAGGGGSYFLLQNLFFGQENPVAVLPDEFFGWKYPTARFPSTGPGDLLAYSDIRDPGGIPQGLPVRLKIPAIGVDSAIEDALITPDGRMDVPSGSVNVAWFALGPQPGQQGSAVIGGHFGIRKGVPFVFYKLDKLKVGDKANIVNDKGDTLTFIVRSIKLFDRNADATTVFTSGDGLAHLNLITCEGVWNQVNGSYPQRRVVFTDLVTTGAATEAITTFNLSFGIGARGADVVALQNILEQKGLLEMPRGVAKGFFGSLTKSAVAKYQASVGVSATGFFGPLTIAKLTAESVSSPILPDAALLPIEEGPLAFTQTFFQGLGDLYATPVDSLITTSLIAAILLAAFKIIRRSALARSLRRE